MMARSFGWSGPGSIAFATSSALLTAVLVFILFVKVFVASQGSSHFRRIDLLGKKAEVIVSLGENRIGTVAFTIGGVRQTAPALSEGGRPIPKGTPVEIIRISDGTVYVRQREG